MILSGVDQLRVIGPAEMARVLMKANVGFIAWYLNSPCQRRTKWKREDVKALTDMGLGSLPIYVGSQSPEHDCESRLSTDLAGEHARDAAVKMAEMGYEPSVGHTCALDIEAQTYGQRPVETADYGAAWCAELDRLGYLPTVYGDRWTLPPIGAQLSIDWQQWLAFWAVREYRPDLTARGLAVDAGLSYRPGRLIVQYASQEVWPHTGLGYDWNVADGHFCGPV